MAYIARVDDFDCGIMISASHNPYYDDGIKLIDCYVESKAVQPILFTRLFDGKTDGELMEALDAVPENAVHVTA